MTVNWGPPNTASHDVAKLQINVEGKGWENVSVSSGSRTVNVGHSTTVDIKVRAINSKGEIGAVASASASSGSKPKPKPPTSWTLQVGGSLEPGFRTCMDPRSGTNYSPGPPASCAGGHWANERNEYPTLVTNCWLVRAGTYWYKQESGGKAKNIGLYIKGEHVTLAGGGSHLGGNPPAGMSKCS